MAANATAIWRVRPSGSNNNGGGYDPGIAGAGTDYSQQNAAQLTQSSTANTSTSTTTLTDTGASFTSAVIGNGIRVAGTGITTTFTFVTAVPSATTLTLQTSPGTTGTAVSYNLGGGWADPFTNTTTTGPIVPGNITYILGSGTPNPASYVYDYTWPNSSVSTAAGNNSAGYTHFKNDPNTPGYKTPPDTTGGMPTIKMSGNSSGWGVVTSRFEGLWFINGFDNSNGFITDSSGSANLELYACVVDALGCQDRQIGAYNGQCMYIACEFFNSAASIGGTYSNFLWVNGNSPSFIVSCNFHDLLSGMGGGNVFIIISNCIIAKNAGNGLDFGGPCHVMNNTIDGNSGHGISLSASSIDRQTIVTNNIISNHTTAGKFGLNVTGTTATNDLLKALIDFNVFYNNTSNYSGISAGAHDTALVVTPYAGSATENYQLA